MPKQKTRPIPLDDLYDDMKEAIKALDLSFREMHLVRVRFIQRADGGVTVNYVGNDRELNFHYRKT